MLPLLVLVVGLAVATLWYVVRPALEAQPVAQRSCEVIILENETKCVAPQAFRAYKAPHGAKR
jgi:hypothetical protein